MKQSFSTLSLRPELLKAIDDLGFEGMTDIQAQSLPILLEGKDVLGQAKTGSGKTVTFALGVLQQLEPKDLHVQSLVMCPTRELAEQVAEEIRSLAKQLENVKVLTLCGGAPMGPQISSLSHGAHVIVGTPGRIMEHVLKRRLMLNKVNTFVLDEADRMLDMGFEEEMDIVIRHISNARQTLLFSATLNDQVKQVSHHIQRNPQFVHVTSTHDEQKIEQLFFEVDESHKVKAAAALISECQPNATIIFCNKKVTAQEVADELSMMGVPALALHGDLEQRARTEVLVRFENQSCRVLVATDVAARGIDVKGVDLVINYHVSEDPDAHIHRIGRTGRADASGRAYSLVSPSEISRVHAIEEVAGFKAKWKGIQSMRFHANRITESEFSTLAIDGGKKAKLRPGDILGALTKEADVPGEDIGKIKVTATHAYVAIKSRSVKRSMRQFREGKIKGKKFKARKLS
ncbi:ATP-dependent RNA helicase DbpA [Aestuariibacter sp. AA17]|uniref:ATP-dependent RNA helicase DbpA n=1 Tax=Fluctibacter corallii TaxID=2984329 RepID=A0ABT3ACI0_9ALTE|nr:ATP-dependent RNA helicase DbpA [Aestuariibacter sp. AA17]MCV2886379.1 ATP-dependent RNA helicase DbpA [Aestuariibacter sp. AA17]